MGTHGDRVRFSTGTSEARFHPYRGPWGDDPHELPVLDHRQVVALVVVRSRRVLHGRIGRDDHGVLLHYRDQRSSSDC